MVPALDVLPQQLPDEMPGHEKSQPMPLALGAGIPGTGDGSDGIVVLASCICSPAAVCQGAQVSGGIAVLDMSEMLWDNFILKQLFRTK